MTSDFTPGEDIGLLTADLAIGNEPAPAKSWTLGGFPPLRFPFELPFTALPDGTDIRVSFSAYAGTTQKEAPFYRREVATSVVADEALLLRAHLEWECVPSFHLPGGELAPTCQSPTTCVAAACEDPFIPPADLEPYSVDWAVDYGDACRPLGAGDPSVAIGQGRSMFEPLVPSDLLLMEKGSQGGVHVWLALRMKNLHQQGSTTEIGVAREDTGEELCFIEVPWDFAPTGSGECDLFGIQCVVAYDVLQANVLTGKSVVVSAKVVDLVGNVGFGEQVATLGTAQ